MGKEAIAEDASSKTKGRVDKLKPEDFIVVKPDQTTYTFVLKPEHRGKIIAVVGERKKKVVAFGTHYSRVVAKAKKLGVKSFSIMFAPDKGAICTR